MMMKRKATPKIISATASPFRPELVPNIIQQESITPQHDEMNVEVPIPMTQEQIVPEPIPMTQEEIIQVPNITQQESITQQPSEMNIHWTKQPSQWARDVPLSVILSAHGPYFLYEDELSVALCNMVGMPAPSLSRSRRMTVLSE